MQHLSIAYGSLMEVETQTLVATRLGYLQPEETTKILEYAAEVGRLINGLSRSLESKLAATDHRPPTTDH